MLRRNQQDLWAGLFLSLIGVAAVIYSLSYPLGSLRQAGPGLFPLILGVVMLGLSLVVIASALLRSGQPLPMLHARQLLSVIGSILAFGLSISTFGLVPAVFLLVTVSSSADARITTKNKIILATTLTALASGVFYYGLGLQFQLVAWPF